MITKWETIIKKSKHPASFVNKILTKKRIDQISKHKHQVIIPIGYWNDQKHSFVTSYKNEIQLSIVK